MVTRRTTMRSKTGTKLYAVRDESGQFKDIQTYKRAHSADMRQTSEAEKVAAQGPIEKRVRKAATAAVKSVRDTVSGAVAVVKRLAKRTVKQASGTPPPGLKATKKTAKKTVKKTAAKKAGKR